MSESVVKPIRRLAVVGAGNMGGGIAQKMAIEGFPVVLVDLDDPAVARGLARIEGSLAEGVSRKLFTDAQSQEIRGRIQGTTDWRSLSDADLVVEAVFEDRAVKQDVFSRLDEACRPDAILATNTSSLSVTELAAATRHPERVLGLHYFYHPAKNRLVEIVPGEATSDLVLRRAWLLQEQIGKTPIHSADRSGFIVNRFFVPWLNEAVRLFGEGVADVPTIEEAAKTSFGVGMGPFELMNVTGVTIAMHAARTLGEAFGPFYGPARRLEEQGRSGKPWSLEGSPDSSKLDAVSERLLAVVFLVASGLVEEGVGTLEDTDIGARVGLRWPRGPFEMMNRMGVARASALATSLASHWGLGVPELLAERARAGKGFRFALVRSETRDGIATLTVNRPDAMNALNEDVVTQLHEAFRRAAADPKVRGIVLAGAGRAFVAGADIRFFVRNIEAKTLERIVEFTKAGHALLEDVDRCPKPVVARLHGLALGGGLELALACDRIVATKRASLAFPETGIGIFPGLGGTQRTPRRVGMALAKWLIFTGQSLTAEEALAIGLVDRVVEHENLDAALQEAIRSGPVTDRRPARVPDRYRDLAELFESADPDALRAGKVETRGREDFARAVKRVGTKAPIALRLAALLIESSRSVTLEEGLRAELDHLVEVFSTRDAYEGLSTLGKRAPVFEGR